MKFSMRFILVLFLIFIFLNSCASTKKNTGENSAEDKKIEDIAVNEPKTETDKEAGIEAVKDVKTANEAHTDSAEDNGTLKDSVPKIEADSETSVSDPKPISDKPALELIVDAEDEPALPSGESNAKEAETSDSQASDKTVISIQDLPNGQPDGRPSSRPKNNPETLLNINEKDKDEKQKLEPAGDSYKIVLPDDKETVISSDSALSAPISESSLETSDMSNKDNSNSNKDNSNMDVVNEEKAEDLEPSRVFSEFPSTEPDETKEERASRSVKLYTGQRLEVVYPGEGWVYLGETSAQKGIKYQQRKLQNGTSTFHFGALDEGSYILNFSHFDVFSDNFISDSIAVHVEKAKTKLNNTVKAPDYKGEVNTAKELEKKDSLKDSLIDKKNNIGSENESKKESEASSTKNDNSKVYDSPDLLTVAEKPESTGQNLKSASELLDTIRGYISEGNAANALNSAEDFFKNYSENLDEALFLRGQAYELNGSNKNVKKALEAYQTLTKAYPESKFWDKADARIRYIKKFYIDIK